MCAIPLVASHHTIIDCWYTWLFTDGLWACFWISYVEQFSLIIIFCFVSSRAVNKLATSQLVGAFALWLRNICFRWILLRGNYLPAT